MKWIRPLYLILILIVFVFDSLSVSLSVILEGEAFSLWFRLYA